MSEPTFSDPPRALPAGSPDTDAWTVGADAEAPIRFLPPMSTTYEIRDSAGRPIRVGDVISGDLTILRNGEPAGGFRVAGERVVDELLPTLRLSAPPPYVLTFSVAHVGTGSGDGRGGNAHDRRKARRAGRLWRSLGDVVRDADDAPDALERAASLVNETMNRAMWSGDALDLRKWTVLPGGEWKVTP